MPTQATIALRQQQGRDRAKARRQAAVEAAMRFWREAECPSEAMIEEVFVELAADRVDGAERILTLLGVWNRVAR